MVSKHASDAASTPPVAPSAAPGKRIDSPEGKAGFLTRLSFGWVTSLVRAGSVRPLQEEDLPLLLQQDDAETLSREFQKAQDELKARGRKASLWTSLFRVFGSVFLFSGLFKLFNDVTLLTAPIILGLLINWLQDPAGDVRVGFMLAGGLFLVTVVNLISANWYFFRTSRIGMHAREVLTAAIFRKTVRTSVAAMNKHSSSGQVLTLMSVDAFRLQEGMMYYHMIWSGPLQIIVAIWLLVRLIGPAAWTGVGVMFIMMPIQGFIMAKVAGNTRELMKVTDERVNVLNEIFNGVRVIKFYAWERLFNKQVDEVRSREMSRLAVNAYLNSFTGFLMGALPVLVSVSTFTVFAAADDGRNMRPELIFPAIALFQVLRFPLTFLPMIIGGVVMAVISVNRMNRFMNLPDQEEANCITDDDDESIMPKDVVVHLKDASFAWDQASEQQAGNDAKHQDEQQQQSEQAKETTTLSDINLSIKRGELIMVVGRVGSGKTSLLAALLGEMERRSGSVAYRGTRSYVSQQPWIVNGKLRDNILFGRGYDEKLYEQTLRVCALSQDLDVLADGDDTEIGERGINLSGGQKQRVSIARAVYAKSSVIVMDDSLSAVDAHVGQHIFNECILGVLKDRTRILATNQVQFMPYADRIVVMEHGRIKSVSTYNQLKGVIEQVVEAEDGKDDAGNADGEGQGVGAEDDAAQEPTALARNASSVSAVSLASSTTKTKTQGDEEDAAAARAMHHGKGAKAREGKLTGVEERELGSVKAGVYLYYAHAMGGGLALAVGIVVIFVIAQAIALGTDAWLSRWTNAQSSKGQLSEPEVRSFLLVYGMLGVATGVAFLIRALSTAVATLNASRKLHNDLLSSVLRAPVSFFDRTPLGRIMNRFSTDMALVDTLLGAFISQAIAVLLSILFIITLLCVAAPVFIPPLGLILYVYYRIQAYYRRTSRELKRLDSITKSPIYAHFGETLAGVASIRAFGASARFIRENIRRVNDNVSAYWMLMVANRWLGFRLESLSSLIVLGVALMAVLDRAYGFGTGTDVGLMSLALTYSLNITAILTFGIRTTVDLENAMNSVERVREYSQALPQEPAAVVASSRPPVDWPSQGCVEFDHVSMKYRPDLPLVLNDVSFTVQPRQKIGVVGRTGAGKSSMMLTLFRIVEPAGGTIRIDGVDITSIGLDDLRSRLAIIPQDPVVFSGTVRSNLDPFSQHDDEAVWTALRRVNLHAHVRGMDGQLDSRVVEGGSNFSQGQRQLICMARALLRNARVLVMDEATSAVDFDTDALIQATVRSEFAQCTVLTIAHRLNTVMDSDRVFVMDAGKVIEDGHPADLLAKADGALSAMVASTGEENAAELRRLAKAARDGAGVSASSPTHVDQQDAPTQL